MLLIQNGTIKTMAGPDIENGQLLLDGGKIAAVGKTVNAPAGTRVLDAAGCIVCPGLVEAHCHTGLREAGVRAEGEDVNEQPADPIVPQMRVIDAMNPMDTAVAEALAWGVTSAVITNGSLNVIGGQALAMKLTGKRIDKMVIKNPVAVKVALGENVKRNYGAHNKSPITRLGTAALLREALFSAREYQQAVDRAAGDPEKMPKFHIKWDALLPVLRREIPFKIHAHRLDDIFTGIRIAREFNLKITLEHCTEGHLAAEEIAAEGFPVIVGPYMTALSKYELRNSDAAGAGILDRAGVKIAIMTDAPVVPLKYLGFSAGVAVKAGLSEETAWRAITINAAEIVGIADRVGSLEVGKDADVVIFKGSPLTDVGCQTVATIVDGEIVYQNPALL